MFSPLACRTTTNTPPGGGESRLESPPQATGCNLMGARKGGREGGREGRTHRVHPHLGCAQLESVGVVGPCAQQDSYGDASGVKLLHQGHLSRGGGGRGRTHNQGSERKRTTRMSAESEIAVTGWPAVQRVCVSRGSLCPAGQLLGCQRGPAAPSRSGGGGEGRTHNQGPKRKRTTRVC